MDYISRYDDVLGLVGRITWLIVRTAMVSHLLKPDPKLYYLYAG